MATFLGFAAHVTDLRAEETPRYSLPIACVPGKTCWIVNYVDQDAGAGASDYACGSQTYDGHTGTDFAVRSLREMRRGVPVVASAAGVVRATRDGVADRPHRRSEPSAAAGHECGNGVIIDHGTEWETQYCHLRRGSVTVRKGERVERGDPLGLVGLSGDTEFAHLHLTLRHSGAIIDPFTGRSAPSGCASAGSPLWTAEAAATLYYRPASIYDAGVAGAAPTMAQVHEGEDIARAQRASPALVAWAAMYGLRTGDEVVLTLTNPEGRILIERRRRVERSQARRVEFAGVRRTAQFWPAGSYRLLARVLRQQAGSAPLAVERSLVVVID